MKKFSLALNIPLETQVALNKAADLSETEKKYSIEILNFFCEEDDAEKIKQQLYATICEDLPKTKRFAELSNHLSNSQNNLLCLPEYIQLENTDEDTTRLFFTLDELSNLCLAHIRARFCEKLGLIVDKIQLPNHEFFYSAQQLNLELKPFLIWQEKIKDEGNEGNEEDEEKKSYLNKLLDGDYIVKCDGHLSLYEEETEIANMQFNSLATPLLKIKYNALYTEKRYQTENHQHRITEKMNAIKAAVARATLAHTLFNLSAHEFEHYKGPSGKQASIAQACDVSRHRRRDAFKTDCVNVLKNFNIFPPQETPITINFNPYKQTTVENEFDTLKTLLAEYIEKDKETQTLTLNTALLTAHLLEHQATREKMEAFHPVFDALYAIACKYSSETSFQTIGEHLTDVLLYYIKANTPALSFARGLLSEFYKGNTSQAKTHYVKVAAQNYSLEAFKPEVSENIEESKQTEKSKQIIQGHNTIN